MKYSELNKELEHKFRGNDFAFVTSALQQSNRDEIVDNKFYDVVSEEAVAYVSQERFCLPLEYDVQFPPPLQADFTFIDLFAGIGGFRIPLQWENGRCVFSSEFNAHAQSVYHANYGEYPFGDITKIPLEFIPKHDVLAAGFPCQPFSISGKMKGFEDTRGTLIYNVFKIVEAKRPKVILLENVKHLLYHDQGNAFESVEVKFDIPITHNIISIVKEKIQPSTVKRFYVLSTQPELSDDQVEIEKDINQIKNTHGCQLVVNGVLPTIKYYLRLLSDTSAFVKHYADLMEKDNSITFEHRQEWNDLVSNL